MGVSNLNNCLYHFKPFGNSKQIDSVICIHDSLNGSSRISAITESEFSNRIGNNYIRIYTFCKQQDR